MSTGHGGSELNREYFDKEAQSYDSKYEKTINQLIEEIQTGLDFIGAEWADEADDDEDDDTQDDAAPPKRLVRLLDYACGTGLVSRALAPNVTQCVGIDLSENMVAAYNSRARNQGLSPSEMQAYQGDLVSADDAEPVALAGPGFCGFDIAAVGLGFHHFDDPALAAARLAARLRPGGVLLVIDFLPHEKMHDHGHGAARTVAHHGFSEEQMRGIFEAAGAGKDFGLQSVGVAFSRPSGEAEVKRKVFMARGVKA